MTASLSHRFLLLLAVFPVSTATIARAQSPQQSSPPAAPAKAAPQKRVTATDSIVVGAHLTPEEIEDGKINEAYQPLYHWKKPADCPQIVQLSASKIIPMAEASKFNETRNKFLFLANREIAGCEMQSGQYQEAENRYQKLFEYMPVWPSMSDSDYPINYRSIGTARLMQRRWKNAEETLEKSIQIFDEQIERALHSDSEFMKNEHSKNLKMSRAETRELLAAAYFQNGRQNEALEMLEKAYQEATQSSATASMIQQIIESGRVVSATLGDAALKGKWDARSAGPK